MTYLHSTNDSLTPPANGTIYESTPWAIKKRASFIFGITLANMDRF